MGLIVLISNTSKSQGYIESTLFNQYNTGTNFTVSLGLDYYYYYYYYYSRFRECGTC
jgi:hypothetical protein